MIGLCFSRDAAQPMAPGLGERFAAALSIGHGGPAVAAEARGAVLVSRPGNGHLAPTGNPSHLPPACLPDGSPVLFTGRIDNRAEIAAALGAPAVPAFDDAALYAAAYGAWGDGCDLKLIGNYAAVIWHPDRRVARLACSPFRAPPLHVWHDGRRAVVASTAGAIFACGVERRVDEQKIADSLYLNYGEAERGWFADVARFPAGSHGLLSCDGLTLRPYWAIADVAPVRLKRDEDYVEAADALFRQATKATLAGFSRPAISLSGGFDSQAVAVYALAELSKDATLLGLTRVPEPGWDGVDAPGDFGDESAHVRALAAMHDRLNPEFIDAAGLGFDHRLDEMFLMAGVAPRNAMNIFWIHELNDRARSRGCDVILGGDSGNLTFSFSGMGALPTLLRRGAWRRLAREITLGREPGRSWFGTFARQAVRPQLPRSVQAMLGRLKGTVPADPFDTWCPLNPGWAREMDVAARARQMGVDVYYCPIPSTAQARRIAPTGGAFEGGDVQQGLDLMHGIPKRDPTGWRPLVEFCAAIPDDQYVKDGVSRRLARRLLAGKLPDMVLRERRRGEQAADWPIRLGRQRKALIAEIDRLSADPAMAARIDFPRLRAALVAWDGTRPPPGSPRAATLVAAVPRALTTARFIRFVEGHHDG